MSTSSESTTTPPPPDDAGESGWQLAGDAAVAYEAHLVPAIFARMADRLVDLAEVGHRAAVLDLACGTGVVARAAARRVGPAGRVIGVDRNPDMLAVASRACADVQPAVTFHRADVADLPLSDGSVDVVLCQEALQFVPDRRAALAECRRVAVAGGTVAFSVLRSLDHHPVYARFAAMLDRHAGVAAGEMIRSPFALGDADELRAATRDAALESVVVRIAVNEERFPSVADFVSHEAASSPLAAALAELPDDRRRALVDNLSRELADHLDDTGLVFANETHIVTARA